jgi:8-amino-7-oxononanoate synthase
VRIDAVAGEALEAVRARGTYRRMRVLAGAQAPRMRVDGREVLLFAGSNYLDLAHHPQVVEAAERAARDHGCASGGSRLISGNLDLHEALEAELAGFLGREAALAFATGYMANVGVITALVGEGDLVLSDALAHASIVDGCRLSRAEVRVVPHGDLDALEAELRAHATARRRVLVAADGVYSMDGDTAPLGELVPLVRRWGAICLLDDAHGTGTLGSAGRGTPELYGVAGEIDAWTGTLGKALGSFGAFAAGSRRFRDLLVNVARSFIFTCALPPPQVEAARAALRVLAAEPWRRARLQQRAGRLRERLAGHGVATAPSTTHIVPVVIGGNAETMALCERLLARGFYTQGIRHPSVPAETARLRITPMATHAEEEIDALADAIAEELPQRAVSRLPARTVAGARAPATPR